MEVLFPILILILLFSVARRLKKMVKYNKERNYLPRRIDLPEKPKEDKGENGENVVMMKLMLLPEDRYKVLHNVTIPLQNGSTQIDHIVLSRYGIFVIETKNYNGSIYGVEHGEYWSQYLGKQKNQFYNPILQNAGHVRAMQKSLNAFKDCPYIPIVVFSDNAEIKVNTKESTVINWNQLLRTISQYQEEKITWEQVCDLYNVLPLLEMNKGEETNQKHLQNLMTAQENKFKIIESGRCPRCGGELILRQGQYGQFYGCSNYPDCRYTHPC